MKKIITSALFLFALLNARGQYMSFFGDSTWEYNVTGISQPPVDYMNNPPEEPNLLGVYCVTYSYWFQKDHHPNPNYWNGSWPIEEVYQQVFHNTENSYLVEINSLVKLYEDTVNGRLYQGGKLICDMSLSEGDTFLLENACNWSAICPWDYYPWDPSLQLSFDISMLVDSVRYDNGRKVIHLSLLDHQDDYFFGTGNSGLLSDYHLSIRFIEGIGPTYGFHHGCFHPSSLPVSEAEALYVYYYPWLSLLQCMYKDDSLVYQAHEALGCAQTCMGDNTYFWESVPDHSPVVMNLYPNPATQYVVLDMSTGEEMHGSVVITDMLGRLCLVQKAEGTKCQIAVSDLPTGMYFLTYSDGERTVTRKFLKR